MPQPNTQEISEILNRELQPRGITAHVRIKQDKAGIEQDSLVILLESDRVPDPERMMPLVSQVILNQGIEPMPIKVGGRQQGNKPAWIKDIDLSTISTVPLDAYQDEYSDEFQEEEFQEEEFQEEEFDYSDEEAGTDDNLNENEDETPSDSLEKSQAFDKDKQKKLLPLLAAIPVVLLLGIGGWWFFLRSPSSQAPAPVGTPAPAEAPGSSPTPAPEAPATPTAEPELSPAEAWRLAINRATNAANLTQTAQTKAEWEAVASEWRKAIELLELVPESSPNYQQAQERLVSYPKNLQYAENAAASRP